MSPFRALALVALTMLAPSAIGCADEGSQDEEVLAGSGGEGDDEIRRASSLLGTVAAVRVNGGTTVAASGKVERVLQNLGLHKGAPKPEEGAYRCMPTYRLEFLNAAGEATATAGLTCGGAGADDRKGAKGSVSVGGKSYFITAKDVDAIDAIAAEPRAVGDVLFGADRVEIMKPGAQSSTKEIKDAAAVAKLVKALEPNQVPDPTARLPRCLPSRSVGFFKGTTELAHASLTCGENERGVVQGAFSVTEPRLYGGVKINAGVVFDAERAAP